MWAVLSPIADVTALTTAASAFEPEPDRCVPTTTPATTTRTTVTMAAATVIGRRNLVREDVAVATGSAGCVDSAGCGAGMLWRYDGCSCGRIPLPVHRLPPTLARRSAARLGSGRTGWIRLRDPMWAGWSRGPGWRRKAGLRRPPHRRQDLRWCRRGRSPKWLERRRTLSRRHLPIWWAYRPPHRSGVRARRTHRPASRCVHPPLVEHVPSIQLETRSKPMIIPGRRRGRRTVPPSVSGSHRPSERGGHSFTATPHSSRGGRVVVRLTYERRAMNFRPESISGGQSRRRSVATAS